MKKVVLASVLTVMAGASMNANAVTATICAAPTAAGNGTADSGWATATSFVKTTFTPKCSANVHLVGNDMTTYYGAGSASAKGKNIFMGSTAGGGVSAYGSCAATGCTANNASTAANAAPAS